MPDLVILAVGAAIGAGAVLLGIATRRWLRRRARATDAERATYRTLHTASRAAAALRGGRSTPDITRAARHLRSLLGARALALVGPDGTVALDGSTDRLDGASLRIAERVRVAGSRQIFPRRQGSPEGWEAVGVPVIVDGVVWGVLIAFASPLRSALVRATGEVAEWCAAQLSLGALDASRSALAEAELKALRAQISPHFVYNALTAIASFVTTDPPRARDLLLEFADFTRYSFRRHGDMTTLSDELRSIHSYLEIERARFGDRLTVRLRISPETLATAIPYLSVQPLVENAVRHGLERAEGGGTLLVASIERDEHVVITVVDDGVGIDPDRVPALLAGEDESDRVGLRNVDARLRQLYGGAGLEVETGAGMGTLVRMRVPKAVDAA